MEITSLSSLYYYITFVLHILVHGLRIILLLLYFFMIRSYGVPTSTYYAICELLTNVKIQLRYFDYKKILIRAVYIIFLHTSTYYILYYIYIQFIIIHFMYYSSRFFFLSMRSFSNRMKIQVCINI